MDEDQIKAQTTEDPWRNIGTGALRVAIYQLMGNDKPGTLTVRKTRGTDGAWVFNVDMKTDK